MKFLASLICVASIFISGCLLCKVDYGDPWPPTSMLGTIPVIGTVTPEEECVLQSTQDALVYIANNYPEHSNINVVSRKPFLFIRTVDDKTPKICERCMKGLYEKDCADSWGEIPDILGIPESHPGNGYGGLSIPNIMINRTPERNNINDLIGLIGHEWGCHEALQLYQHNDQCTIMSRLTISKTKEIMRANPDCSQYLE